MLAVRDRVQGSARPLVSSFDVAMLDLDGVVYVGPDAVPGVPDALARARSEGLRLAFVTNNASRTPEQVAAHLTELGIGSEAAEVITSAQAAARYLAARLQPGSTVLVLGTAALRSAMSEQGLQPVESAVDDVRAVVQGYSPHADWAMLAEGAVAINAGALWVATNTDPTVPSPRGPLPGNGSLVAALQRATRTDPVVTGKPDPTMHRETLIRTGARRPVVVGDRLDTDIEGANNVGCPSLLVFSGVTTVADLLAAPPQHRPTYIAADLAGLLATHPETELDDGRAACGRWTARVDRGSVELETRSDPGLPGHGPTTPQRRDALGRVAPDDDSLDAVRALCAACWHLVDRSSSSRPGSGSGSGPRAGESVRASISAADGDAGAAHVLRQLGVAHG